MTNQEPDRTLVQQAAFLAGRDGVEIDIWSRSRIADVLDVDARGQFVRKKLLNIDEELLSLDLLVELGRESVRSFSAGDNPGDRVDREIDNQVGYASTPITFVVGA
jgi:hypothetical protein